MKTSIIELGPVTPLELIADPGVTTMNFPELDDFHQEWVRALDAIRDPLFVLDDQGHVVRMNVAFAALCDCDLVEAIGMHLAVLLPWHKYFAAAKYGTFIVEGRDTVIAPDGRIFSRREFPFDDSGHRLIILEDVSAEVALVSATEDSQAAVRATLIDAIGCIVETLRVKDPYTASHSGRVAKLARGIAEIMDMSQHESEGVYYGGLLHDIGKLYVPSEILNRPGRLSREEMALIRTHAGKGSSILMGLHFPWPIRDMVVQHHERLDGSGYPAGLSGEQLSAAVRILGVADTVEAMTSHRPYRPSLGVDAAIAVLQEGSGRTFDADVVNACIRMLRSGETGFNYALPAFDISG
jgi:putative nucleotidyltransferase with HDIG domain